VSFSFDARFGPSSKTLGEIITHSSGMLLAHGMMFMECVWELHPSGEGSPTIDTPSPTSVSEINDVVALTANWWGRSLEWHSPEFGEVYLQIFSAFAAETRGYYVVYNEGRSAVHRRMRDSDAKESLLGMLTEFMSALEVPICTYGDKSGAFFRPPTLKDIQDMIDRNVKWTKAIAIADTSLLTPALLDALRKNDEIVSWTVDGRVIVSKI
jgi:hypothetical protein